MRLSVVTFIVVMLVAGPAAAQEREHGFVDAYVGMTKLFESDVPTWTFEDEVGVGGLRVGMWINDIMAITLRSWYFQTDVKQQRSGPSDLDYLGVSLELLVRWKLSDRWAVYGAFGPMMAVNTLDISPVLTGTDDDARSVAPGASVAAGVEVRLLSHLRAFAEVQGSLVYPEFEFADRTITPRITNMYGLFGLRVPF